MTSALVNVTHDKGIFPIPRVGGRTPLLNTVLRRADMEMLQGSAGFHVEVLKDPYDHITAHNDSVRRAAAVADPEGAAVGETLEQFEADQDPVDEAEEATPEGAPEATPAEEAADVETQAMDPDELAELRARIEALTSKKDLEALMAEFEITFEATAEKPAPTKFTEMKAALLEMVSDAAPDESAE
jgi:hypothetical protein